MALYHTFARKSQLPFSFFLIPWWKQVVTRNLAKSKPFVMVSAFTDTVVTCSSRMSAFIVSEASVFSNSKWILMERKKTQQPVNTKKRNSQHLPTTEMADNSGKLCNLTTHSKRCVYFVLYFVYFLRLLLYLMFIYNSQIFSDWECI